MGILQCPQCGHFGSTDDLGLCPSCGCELKPRPVSPISLEHPFEWIRRYFTRLWSVLSNPSKFFKEMPLEGGLSQPLAFALVTHWLGSATEYLWHLAIRGSLGGYFSRLFQIAGDVVEIDNPGRRAQFIEAKERILAWFWGATSVITDPFLTLFSILFTSVLVFIGARILVDPGKDGSPREITYESALRIICYGMSPAILASIPLFGGVISSICVMIVTVIGAREVYRIGTTRALAVALFPKLLFLGIMFMGFLAFALAMIKLIASVL